MSTPFSKRIPLDAVIEEAASDPTSGIMVYFAYTLPDKSQFKIGFTTRRPDLRTHELALGNSKIRLWCAMPGSHTLERLLKCRMLKDSVDGREIFRTSPWRAYIENLVRSKGGVFY